MKAQFTVYFQIVYKIPIIDEPIRFIFKQYFFLIIFQFNQLEELVRKVKVAIVWIWFFILLGFDLGSIIFFPEKEKHS